MSDLATIACIDMEFGHVCGTRSALIMPLEVGAVLYAPGADRMEYAGTRVIADMDVEIWQNVVDAHGMTAGVTVSVANSGRNETGKPFDPRFRLSPEERREAKRVVLQAYRDCGGFVADLLATRAISTLIFYAERMEREALHRAGISVRSYERRDLQREIRMLLGMDHLLSLDRASSIIGFAADGLSIGSHHFSYPVPASFRDQIRPHRAVGDAARMFLLFRECSGFPERFVLRAHRHLRACAERVADTGAEGKNGPA
jgi:hypothetical protein